MLSPEDKKRYDELPKAPMEISVTDTLIRHELKRHLAFYLQKVELNKMGYATVHFYLCVIISQIIFFGAVNSLNCFNDIRHHYLDNQDHLAFSAAFDIAYDLCVNKGNKVREIGEGWPL